MSFPAIKDAAPITPAEFKAANDVLNIKVTKVIGEIARDHRVWMTRSLISRLKPSHFAVLSAISSRTLGWGKIMEKIPLRHFSKGIRDGAGVPKPDNYGFSIFEGTGLDVVTIRKAIAELLSRGLISRFALQGERSESSVYMPMSCIMLLAALTTSDRKGDALVDLPDFIQADARKGLGLTEEEAEWCARYVPVVEQENAA